MTKDFLPFRKTLEQMNAIDIVDGQIFFLTDTQEIYIDVANSEGTVERKLISNYFSGVEPTELKTGTLTLANWDNSTKTQNISIEGLTAESVLIIGLNVSDNVEVASQEQQEWTKIVKAETSANSITFSCLEELPLIDLNFIAKEI